jgi:hypothetical protein
MVLRQCDVFEKEMVAQEILGVRLGNYTGWEKNISEIVMTRPEVPQRQIVGGWLLISCVSVRDSSLV